LFLDFQNLQRITLHSKFFSSTALSENTHTTILLFEPTSPEDIHSVREIFLEYANTLNVDLCFQGFELELQELPGEYAPPRGALLLAMVNQQVAGCCALRPLDSADVRRHGYSSIFLDTLDEMETARALYEDLGFEEIPPYYHNPVPGAHYLRVML